MHKEAYEYVQRMVDEHGPFKSVLDVGGRNINGTVRNLFLTSGTHPDAYQVIDYVPHHSVNVVADYLTWKTPVYWDCIVCCEVLEHHSKPWAIVYKIGRDLLQGGIFIGTMAMNPRRPHSGIDGTDNVRSNEHYGNIDPAKLRSWARRWSASVDIETHDKRGDLYICAVKKGSK